MRNLLVLDVHNLCYRSWYALPALSFGKQSTEVIYGFLRQAEHLCSYLVVTDVAFCFDDQHLARKEEFPGYKARRKAPADKPERDKSDLLKQINRLFQILKRAGCPNVFRFAGMESDDIMAAIARGRAYARHLETTLVTSDSDLYQCFAPNVYIWAPHHKKLLSLGWFAKKYGITPAQWILVKSIAGCKTDNIPGLAGIGEITALKYARTELPDTSKAWQAIRSWEGKKLTRRNRSLVELPHATCPRPEIVVGSPVPWKQLMRSIGAKL